MHEASPLPHPPADLWQQLEITQAADRQDFGRLLKAYRELQNPPIKQADLAKALGLTQGHLSKMERNKTPAANLDKLRRWALCIGAPSHLLWFKMPNTPDEPKSNANDVGIITDVDRREFLKLAASTTGLAAATVTNPVQSSVSHAIGTSDVERLRYWTQSFRQMDNRWGGGHSLDQAVHYLTTDVVPMLREARISSKVRRSLLVEAAQLFQLTGWMHYDTNTPELGRRALRNAFQLADEAGDHALAAEMQAGMSHQTAFVKQADLAQDYAVNARHHAKLSGLPSIRSEAAIMEAHALALQGDLRGTIRALSDAQDEFSKARPSETPTWHTYYDHAYVAAKFGHVLRDLGRPDDAEQYARASLKMTDGYERGRGFNLNLLAGILADRSQLDEAISHAELALQATVSIRSSRMRNYFTDVAQRLQPYSGDHRVKRYYRELAKRGISPVAN